MKVVDEYIDTVYQFKGLWDLPSACGLKILRSDKHTVVLVSELYRENPGTSITNVTASLAMQICHDHEIDPKKMIYIERCPEMKSKLNFYSERNYTVTFTFIDGVLNNPQYAEISLEELRKYIS
ncbi:MAG TPA: hypothetical protein PLZ52_04875 [Bacteroidales bacterium]|nr:hypothetical protein [Bacteroidales bacterium]HQL70164.1 hypothetical protein [Bacteroidales bacterium]